MPNHSQRNEDALLIEPVTGCIPTLAGGRRAMEPGFRMAEVGGKKEKLRRLNSILETNWDKEFIFRRSSRLLMLCSEI